MPWRYVISQQPAPQSSAWRDRVQVALDEWRASVNAPGASLGIVLKDGTATGFVSGVSDRTAKTPMRVDDLLMAGSTGKTFFAAVALQLIEAGRLDLNAPISRYLGDRPWFSRLPNATSVTVRMLMTHTSGLVRYEMNPKFTADLRAQPDKRGRLKKKSPTSSTQRRRSRPARAGTTRTPTTSCSA